MRAEATGSIEIRDLTKGFGAAMVFEHLNLAVNGGELMTLVGSSGCGKSTLLRIIAGLETADSGEVIFCGSSLEPGQVGFVFQRPVLYPHLTVQQNILFSFQLRKSPRIDREHFDSLVQTLGLGDQLKKRPSQISGGQAQRAGIARALVRSTPVVLFDEPLSSVDEQLSGAIRADIQRLHTELGFTGIYVTHHQNEALQMGQRIAVLAGGTIVQVDTPQQVMDFPATAEVARLLLADYNLVQVKTRGRGARLGIPAFGFRQGEGKNLLHCRVRKVGVHPAGYRTELELLESTRLGGVVLPSGCRFTAVLPGTVQLHQTVQLQAPKHHLFLCD